MGLGRVVRWLAGEDTIYCNGVAPKCTLSLVSFLCSISDWNLRVCFKLLSWRSDVAFPMQENQPGSKPDDDEKNQYQNIPRMATLQFLNATMRWRSESVVSWDQVVPGLSSKDMN